MSKTKRFVLALALSAGVLYSQSSNVLSYYTTLQIVTGRAVVKIPTDLSLTIIRDADGNVADVRLNQHIDYAVVGMGSDTVQLTNGSVTSLTPDTNAEGFVF